MSIEEVLMTVDGILYKFTNNSIKYPQNMNLLLATQTSKRAVMIDY